MGLSKNCVPPKLGGFPTNIDHDWSVKGYHHVWTKGGLMMVDNGRPPLWVRHSSWLTI